jgi:uncharacterized membrane protein
MLYAIPLLGLMTGCRTMSPMAVLCWFLCFGQLHVEGTWAFWAAKLVTVIVFTVLAAGELIGDKLPQTPNRTALLPLVARILFGGLVGGIIATGLHASLNVGVLAGSVFALAGAFFGYHIRRLLVTKGKLPDFAVALAEDAVVIAVSIVALRSLHS